MQLARRGIRSLLIDGSGRFGRGIAYSTTEPAHLLNVPAEGMSAIAGDPDHFARAFAAEGGERRGFAQRRFFARYLGGILDQAVTTGCIEMMEATAIGAVRVGKGWHVDFDDGSSIESQALALAAGNQDPASLQAFGGVGDRFVRNPWGEDARKAVEDLATGGADALIVGTGLTMVDLVLSLDAAGYGARLWRCRVTDFSRARMRMSSRAGRDQRYSHGQRPWPLRWIRRRSAEVGWRAAVDSFRPYSHPLWQSLDEDEQRRFLSHARPYWDVHRHRIAPEVGATIARTISEGRLEIVAGRIVSAQGTIKAWKSDIADGTRALTNR